ncbi:MAG: hypothetical protein LBS31_08535, partial [Candidatus Adiutrix sp.]|nr:hypothetical protein [Candidatus Adiutrix sp.]
MKQFIKHLRNRLISPISDDLFLLKHMLENQRERLDLLCSSNDRLVSFLDGLEREREREREREGGGGLRNTVIQKIFVQRWKLLSEVDELRFGNYTFSCPICDGTIAVATAESLEAECIFHGGSLKRFICPICGCIVGPLKMLYLSEKELEEDYKQHYAIFSEGDTTDYEKFT